MFAESECCSADGPAGNSTFGCSPLKEALLQIISVSVKGDLGSHRQVGFVAQLEVEVKAVSASNTRLHLQPLKCIVLPQQHIHRSSKAGSSSRACQSSVHSAPSCNVNGILTTMPCLAASK